MSAPLKPWEVYNLQNSTHLVKNSNVLSGAGRSAPVLPPRPSNSPLISHNGYSSYNTYVPYSGYGNCTSYGSSLGSYGMPFRSSLYNTYNSSYSGYNNYGIYGNGMYPNFTNDDHERRFIQYAEESSRKTFASVESVVCAVNSISMMLDNTFFAMTTSFRAVLSVAESFGRLRTMFGHLWYSINIFRFFSWMYKKLMQMMGYKDLGSVTSVAWKEALHDIPPPSNGRLPSSTWPAIAFLGMLISAPYVISKFLPKYEDKGDPSNWKSPGIRAKVVFDFVATTPNELTIQTNDILFLAPTYIQEEMNLKNSGWAFAVCKGKSGIVPLNYLLISKSRHTNSDFNETIPVPRMTLNGNDHNVKTHTKRVSFGENQIFENIDVDDYVTEKTPNITSHGKQEKFDIQPSKLTLPCENEKINSKEVK